MDVSGATSILQTSPQQVQGLSQTPVVDATKASPSGESNLALTAEPANDQVVAETVAASPSVDENETLGGTLDVVA